VVEDANFNKKLVGFISRADLTRAVKISYADGFEPSTPCSFYGSPANVDDEEYLKLQSYMDLHPIKVDPEVPLDVLLDIFKGLGSGYVMVCKSGILVGIVKKKDMTEMIDAAISSSRAITSSVLSGRYVGKERDSPRSSYVQ